MTLLREIQKATTESEVDLADTLRKCKVLAARLKHQEFTDWVNHELNGYPREAELPGYRKSKGISKGHFFGPGGAKLTDAQIPPVVMPEEIRHIVTDTDLRTPVSGLQEMISRAPDGVIKLVWPGDVIVYVQQHVSIYPEMDLVEAYKMLSTATVRSVLDTVKTRILDFCLAIEQENPQAGDIGPQDPPPIDRERVTNIYNTTVNNSGQAIIASPNATMDAGDINLSPTIPAQQREELVRLLGGLRNKLATVEQLAERQEGSEAISKAESQLSKPSPDWGRIRDYLSIAAAIAKVVTPTMEAFDAVRRSLGL
jgi:hypothetical protein